MARGSMNNCCGLLEQFNQISVWFLNPIMHIFRINAVETGENGVLH